MAAYDGSRSHASGSTFLAAGRLAALLALSATSLLAGCASENTDGLGTPGEVTEEAADLAAWKAEVQPARTLDKCAYPTAQVGVGKGDTVRDQLHWEAYVDGATSTTDVEASDYLDCTGVKGINALLVIQSATWCGFCEQEAEHISQHMADAEDWPAKGIMAVTLMVEDLDSSPATVRTALNWRNKFKLNNSVVAADPNISFVDPTVGEFGLPVVVVVDPRTMEIIDTQQGYSDDFSLLESTARKNAN